MEKTYNPTAIEHWYEKWESQEHFIPNGDKPYCIMIPPPNVTGTLHMGHGFQLSLMDALIRYHRMCGDKTLWQVGTDHAGIATQMVVERELAKENKSRHDLGRDAFVEKVWEWKQRSGSRITNQVRRLGASVDWSRERFTMDEGLSHAVQEVFISLYREGLIYRGQRLVNWDPKFLTAISDLEVVNEEEQGHLWHIRYPLSDGSGSVVIATTRPETLLGDTAVAVHPDDPRYQAFHGKSIQLPLCDREIPLILDTDVDQEFGTGCLKITPAHDFNDYQIGQRHQLDMIDILTDDAHINTNAPAAYQGMDRYEARKQIVEDLKQLGLLEKIEPHQHKIPRGDRSGVVIEPRLTNQWFVKMESLAQAGIDVVANNQIKFIPDNWRKTYFQWLENIEDWCISRQLWWGHRIPAWYDEAGNVYVGQDEQEVRTREKLGDVSLTQDEDVLDTWFSSALWPFSTLGWPEETEALKTFYPTQVLVTGFDIIFFWVARMIMMGLKFTDEIPFHEVYITGLIRDSEGQKMSKSKGNILDPLDLVDGINLEDLIEKRTQHMLVPKQKEAIIKQTRKEFPDGIKAYGVDAVRFTFCALASHGRDVRFDVARLEGYRNFCNKLWNASRFVLMNVEEETFSDMKLETLSLPDRFILDRLQHTIQSTHSYFRQYRFDLMCKTLYEFIWHEYCDWYLELVKPTIYGDDAKSKRTTQFVLLTVLDHILRLLHPLMPYITEAIFQQIKIPLGLNDDSIMTAKFPEVNEDLFDEDAVISTQWVKNFIIGIRNIRGEMNISPNREVHVICHKTQTQDVDLIRANQTYLMSLAKLSDIQITQANDPLPTSAMTLAGEMEIHIPMKGLIDTQEELARIHREIEKVDKDLKRAKSKLDNPNFMDNAPDDVKAKELERAKAYSQKLAQLKEQHEKMQALSD